MFLSLVRIFQNHNSRYWIIILYFATSTGTSLKASPRVSSLDHCLYNCCQIVHSNLKCTTNFYSALAILPPLDPDRVFFFWSVIVAMSRGRMKPFQKCENDKRGAPSKYVNQVLWLVILTNFTTLLLKTMNNICSFPSGRESLSPEHLKASTAPVKVMCFSSFFIPLSWSLH